MIEDTAKAPPCAEREEWVKPELTRFDAADAETAGGFGGDAAFS